MLQSHRYKNIIKDTMIWKRNHPDRTRRTQYKTYSKHWIRDANKSQLKKAQTWHDQGQKYLDKQK